EQAPCAHALRRGPRRTDGGLHRLVVRVHVVGFVQRPVRQRLPVGNPFRRVDGDPGNAGRFEGVLGERGAAPDGRHDVLALCPLVANGGPERVILVGRDVVDELGAIRPLWRTLPAATTGGGRCPLLIPGLPLAGIVERLALGARDPSAVIGERSEGRRVGKGRGRRRARRPRNEALR